MATDRVEQVVVVGAGLGGLSAALHLAGAGRSVTVVEQGTEPGGLAAGLSVDEYAFDSGPTVLTLPHLIDQALAAVGERAADRLELVRLDPAYVARFADGSRLAVRTDVDAMSEEIATVIGPGAVDGYRRLVRRLRTLYEVQAAAFIGRNLDRLTDLPVRPALRLIAAGGVRRWSALVDSFVTDDRLRRVFSFQALYAGVAPQRALAAYAVIAYMDCVSGVYYPRGGMRAVPRALAAAAAAHGVQFRYGTRAVGLTTAGGRVRAVRTTGGDLPADAVVWNGDPGAARALLGRPPARRPLRYAPSCLLLHTATTGTPADAHHMIHFGAAWHSTFADLIEHGRPMADPSVLISTPTVTDPDLAPAGRHTHYTLLPVPNRHVAPQRRWTAGDRALIDDVLRARGLGAITTDAEVAVLTTPADWSAVGLPAGTPFGPQHSASQTGPLRQPTRDRHLPNLLYAGAATQPGVGVPSVLVSGRLAAERLLP